MSIELLYNLKCSAVSVVNILCLPNKLSKEILHQQRIERTIYCYSNSTFISNNHNLLSITLSA